MDITNIEGISKLESRVEELLKRIDDLRNDVNHRFEELRDDMNHKFEDINHMIAIVQ